MFFAAGDKRKCGKQLIVPTVGRLEACSLRHHYPGADSLTGFSVAASRGEIIALVGENGTGKTTTVNALLGLTELSGGTVAIVGHTQAELSQDAGLGRFGLLTPEFGRYEMTVRDAICLGTPRTNITDAKVWAALESAHAASLVRKFPDDTPSGYIWPIALAIHGRTTPDRAEKLALLQLLRDTTGGTGLLHEGFDPSDPARFTRPWFSWANSMFAELLLDFCGIGD